MQTLTPRTARVGLLALLTTVVAAFAVVAAPAQAANHDDGCHVYGEYPLYLNGKMHYHGYTRCHHNEFAITEYIGNEWFKPGHDTESWEGHKTHECNPGYGIKRCSVSSTGPYKGPGEYCTVVMSDLWFVNRISTRRCTTMG